MTHTLKKVVSLLLSVLMLASVCVCAFAETTGNATTYNDLGVTDGDNKKVYDDPTGTGDKVLRFDVSNNRPNFELADPTNNTTAFEPVAGKIYTIKFDYYVDQAELGANFTLYYGAQSLYAEGYSKVSFTSTNIGILGAGEYDGKWHTALMTFKAEAKTGNVGGVANQPLEKLYLTTCYGGDVKVYFKNIEINTESGSSTTLYSNNTYNLRGYFDENGVAKTSMFDNNSTIASIMRNSYYDDANGYAVIKPENGTYAEIGNSRSTRFLNVVSGDTPQTSVLAEAGYNYAVVVKYKILKASTVEGKTTIGIGTGTSDKIGWTLTNVYANIGQVDAKNSDWQYLYATFSPATSGFIRITVTGKDAEIALDTIQIAEARTDNAFINFFNDNGAGISVEAGYKGCDITTVGANEYNLKLGEKFMGWYDNPHFTGEPVTTFSTNGTLYAKYPSVVVDFNYRTTMTLNYGYVYPECKIENGVYIAKVGYGGVMIPSYDAVINDKLDENDPNPEAFYKFVNGQKYKITYYLNSIKISNNSTNASIYSLSLDE